MALALILLVALPATSASAAGGGIKGQVTNESGQPIANACLTLYQHIRDGAQGSPLGNFCTDATGHYAITGVPERSYAILVQAPGYRSEWLFKGVTHLNARQMGPFAQYMATIDLVLGVGSGTIKGRITNQTGAGDLQTTVTVHRIGVDWSNIAYTWDTDGNYEFPNLAPGDYKVSIYDNSRGWQWIAGKENQNDALVFTVTDGSVVIADDRWLSPGSVQVTVRDSVTGALVPRACVHISSAPSQRQACGDNGVVSIADVPAGDWPMIVSAAPSHFATQNDRIQVVRGQQTTLERNLVAGAGLTARVLDRATGAAAANVCMHLVRPESGGQSAHMLQHCADRDGVLRLGPFAEPLDFYLYAFQARGAGDPLVYGDQWVGPAGGTGDQREAKLIELRAGAVVDGPTVLMDRPGTITGTVRDKATGAPAPGVCAYPYAFHNGQGGISGQHCSNANGVYTINDVGPYRWPVEFLGSTWQWSGDVADRFAASYTQVTAGGVAVLNASIAAPAKISGTVTGPGSGDPGYVWVYNARTGDLAGPWTSFGSPNPSGVFTVNGLARQDVWVKLQVGDRDCWYGQYVSTSPGRRSSLQLARVGVVAGQTTALTVNTEADCVAQRVAAPRRPVAGVDLPAESAQWAWGRRVAALAAQVRR